MGDSDGDLKYGSALIITLAGLLVIGLLAYVLPTKDGAWKPSEVTALVGSLTTFIGTIVGAFFGVQATASGRRQAEVVAQKALAALDPETAAEITKK